MLPTCSVEKTSRGKPCFLAGMGEKALLKCVLDAIYRSGSLSLSPRWAFCRLRQ